MQGARVLPVRLRTRMLILGWRILVVDATEVHAEVAVVNAAFPAKLQNGPRGMVDVHQADHQGNAMLISDPGELGAGASGRSPDRGAVVR